MSENLKLFLEKVSADAELSKKVSEEKDATVLIAMAKDMGVTLTAEDLKKPVEEITDDDLDVVAGGSDVNCVCVMGGGGSGDDNDKTCGCALAGFGDNNDNRIRCSCAFGGYGYDK